MLLLLLLKGHDDNGVIWVYWKFCRVRIPLYRINLLVSILAADLRSHISNACVFSFESGFTSSNNCIWLRDTTMNTTVLLWCVSHRMNTPVRLKDWITQRAILVIHVILVLHAWSIPHANRLCWDFIYSLYCPEVCIDQSVVSIDWTGL